MISLNVNIAWFRGRKSLLRMASLLVFILNGELLHSANVATGSLQTMVVCKNKLILHALLMKMIPFLLWTLLL